MKEEIERFQSAGRRFAIRLQDGTELEGYILECLEDGFLFGQGGPLAPEEDDWILYSELDTESLFYYCDKSKRYLQWHCG